MVRGRRFVRSGWRAPGLGQYGASRDHETTRDEEETRFIAFLLYNGVTDYCSFTSGETKGTVGAPKPKAIRQYDINLSLLRFPGRIIAVEFGSSIVEVDSRRHRILFENN
jgi:hypothetical protein